MMEVFKQIGFTTLVLLGTGINVLLFLLSVGCYYVFSRFSEHENLQEEAQQLTRKDVQLSLVVIGCNTLVFILGFYLWQKDILVVRASTSVLRVAGAVIALIFIMDFLMYIFHRVAHLPLLYKLFHLTHHRHQSTNALSLFVLHPAEALGFGGLFVMVILIYPFSYAAITIYLGINLLWGTIGHLNKEILPKRFSSALQSGLLGTTRFHNDHHLHPDYNYGFYTVLWDRLFGTLYFDKNSKDPV